MPSTRLTSVAAAIAPDDLSICDIARKAKVQSPKAKAQSSPKVRRSSAFVLVVLVLAIESGEESRTSLRADASARQARTRRRTRRIEGRILTLPPERNSLERGCVPGTSRSALKSSAAAGVFQQVTHASLRRLVPPGGTQPRSGGSVKMCPD